MKRAVPAFFIAALSTAALGQSGGMQGMDMKDMDHKGMDMKMEKGAKKPAAKSHHASGTVKSVSAEKGTVSIDHGPIASMNWPAMNMTFKARDKKVLEGVKPGANIDFDFEQHGKDYVITKVK